MAQYFRDDISYKTKTAIAHKRKNGEKIGRHAEYGFGVDLEGKLIPNLDERQAIALMIQLREQGYTLQSIACELERRQVKNRVGKIRWYAGTIKSVLDRQSKALEVA